MPRIFIRVFVYLFGAAQPVVNFALRASEHERRSPTLSVKASLFRRFKSSKASVSA
jgi:hypothetical protein